MFIRSERVFLRPAWPEEAAELSLLVRDRAGVMSNVDWRDHAEGSNAAGGAARTLLDLVITLPSTTGAPLIGGISLTAQGSGADEAHLGYWLSRSHWGHGYAAEAARGLLALARLLGHARVFARQSVDDRASLLVLTRAGFRPTGERRIEGERVAAIYVAEIGEDRGNDHDDADEVRAA